jgi:peptidoglycan/LPS O-acetylase OafA/YrhL
VFLCHACLLWMMVHVESPSRAIAYLGSFGVAIFFVVSGLVIYRPFVEARSSGVTPDLRAYAVRRMIRIVPAYWVALAVFAVVLPAEVGYPISSGHLGMFAAFGQIYSPGYYYSGLGPAWSLDVEVCFYAAAPVVAFASHWLIERGGRRHLEDLLLLCLGLASIAVRRFSPDGIVGGTILGYSGWFTIGMALAVASVDRRPLLRNLRARPAALWAIAAAGYMLLSGQFAFVRPTQGTLLDYCGLGLLATLVVLGAVIDDGDRATRIGKWLGDRSYGIYLWHYPILYWLTGQDLSVWRYLAIGILTTLLAAHLSFVFVERPLMHQAAAFGARRVAINRAQRATRGHAQGVADTASTIAAA